MFFVAQVIGLCIQAVGLGPQTRWTATGITGLYMKGSYWYYAKWNPSNTSDERYWNDSVKYGKSRPIVNDHNQGDATNNPHKNLGVNVLYLDGHVKWATWNSYINTGCNDYPGGMMDAFIAGAL